MNILLLIDKYTTSVTNTTATYLKNPSQIDLNNNCKLATQLHEELIRLAVDMYHADKFKLNSGNND